MSGAEQHPAVVTFRRNIDQVLELMTFDERLLYFVREGLSRLVDRQRAALMPMPPQFDAAPTLTLVERIRDNESLKPYYKAIHNQCLVLLVSHFASAVRALYISLASESITKFRMTRKLENETLDVTVVDAAIYGSAGQVHELIAHLLAERKGTSFQDMKSISRVFGDFLGYAPPKTEHTNNIILAQACRHAIVHANGLIDDRLLKQVADAIPRQLKPTLKMSGSIEFVPEEITIASQSMVVYLNDVHLGVRRWIDG